MLELKHISHQYENTKRNTRGFVLDDITFSIQKGNLISIVGSSGCGKTTLVNIIAGYISPTKGGVFINGNKISLPNKDKIVINQEHDLFDWMTVRENMEIVWRNKEDIENCLSMVGLSNFSEAYPHELSGGMKKRLSFARALVVKPEFIIMDEPFSSLDFQLRENMQDFVLDIVKRSGQTVLFVTHDIEEAVFLSDEVVVLSGSPTRIKCRIDTSAITGNDNHIRDSEEFLALKRKIKELLIK